MASGSAVGSGKRVSTARSGGVPLGAKARSRWRTRNLAPPRGRGREARAEGHGEAAEHEPDRLQLGDGGLEGQAEDQALRRATGPEGLDLLATGARPDLRPSSPNLATSADAASSATWPIRRRPKRRSLARISPSGVSEAGSGARNAASAPGGTETSSSGCAARAATVAAKRVPAMPARADPRAAPPGPRRRARPAPARAPTAPRARRSGPPGARRRRRSLGRAGDRGADAARRSKAASSSARSASGLGVEERRLRRQPVRRSERHPAPDPERPSRGIGVEHRPVRPGLPAEDDRPRRPRAGGPAPPREVEEEMWSMEMKQSHSSIPGHWEDGAVG